MKSDQKVREKENERERENHLAMVDSALHCGVERERRWHRQNDRSMHHWQSEGEERLPVGQTEEAAVGEERKRTKGMRKEESGELLWTVKIKHRFIWRQGMPLNVD